MDTYMKADKWILRLKSPFTPSFSNPPSKPISQFSSLQPISAISSGTSNPGQLSFLYFGEIPAYGFVLAVANFYRAPDMLGGGGGGGGRRAAGGGAAARRRRQQSACVCADREAPSVVSQI